MKTQKTSIAGRRHKKEDPRILDVLVIIALMALIMYMVDGPHKMSMNVIRVARHILPADVANMIYSHLAGTNEGLHDRSREKSGRSAYEIITYDPFIDGIFNGSKTMVFIVNPTTYISYNTHICDELEFLQGAVITLKSYINYTRGSLGLLKRIDNVLVKRIVHVQLINKIIGDFSVNCGECNEKFGKPLFCEAAKIRDVYAYFMPGLSPNVIIETIFSSYVNHLNMFDNWHMHNNGNRSSYTCQGYSMSERNGYYFSIPGLMLKSGIVKSHITYSPMSTYEIDKARSSYRQCFIEIELME